MKKIPSLFKRDYSGADVHNLPLLDEITPGCEWVVNGEGAPTIKHDGTACMLRDGKWFKRFDRKPTQAAKKKGPPYHPEHCKAAPPGWEACIAAPDATTGHWPGWIPIGDEPESKWHREAIEQGRIYGDLGDGTYELVGPKVQDNPYALANVELWRHGLRFPDGVDPPRRFASLRAWFEFNVIEGIVWHHTDGRMCKIKRRDFGLSWPVSK